MGVKHNEQSTSTALHGTPGVGIAAEIHAIVLVKGFLHFEGIVRKLPPAKCPLCLQIQSAVASARQTTCKCFCVLLWDLQQSPELETQSKQGFCTLVIRQRMKDINVKIMSTTPAKW